MFTTLPGRNGYTRFSNTAQRSVHFEQLVISLVLSGERREHSMSDIAPPPDYVLFNKSALVLVLCQIRFPTLPRFSEPRHIDVFYQAIRNDYPKSDRTIQMGFPFPGDQDGNTSSSTTLWRFSSIDDQWSLLLSENALTIESRNYKSFQDFSDRFIRAVKQLCEALDPELQLRLGLRYINEFRMPDATSLGDWRKYIHEDVLGLTATIHDHFQRSRVAFSRQELELELSDGSLVIRHGLHFGTTGEAAAAAQAVQQMTQHGPFYLLDMDRSDSNPQEIVPDVIASRLQDFNDQMYRFFRWAIREPMYQALEPSNANELS